MPDCPVPDTTRPPRQNARSRHGSVPARLSIRDARARNPGHED